jgi:dihydroflavonol-4-reductase
MMNLITGGTGFLGAHLAAHLLKQQQDVKIFKRHDSSLSELQYIFKYHFAEQANAFFQKIRFIDGDLMNPADIGTAIEKVRHFYHCAGFVSFDGKDKIRINETNVIGTRNIINILVDFPDIKFCHVSSIAALGRSKNKALVNEGVLWEEHGQNSAYSRSKYLSELEVWRGIAEGLNAVIVNPGVILGTGNPEKGSCKLFRLVEKGLRFYTEGINGYVDVTDVAEIMFKLMHTDISGKRFILVSENISYRELFRLMAVAYGLKAPDIHATFPLRKFIVKADHLLSFLPGRERHYSPDFAILAGQKTMYDASALKTALSYDFTPLKKCISNTCSYFTKTPYE